MVLAFVVVLNLWSNFDKKALRQVRKILVTSNRRLVIRFNWALGLGPIVYNIRLRTKSTSRATFFCVGPGVLLELIVTIYLYRDTSIQKLDEIPC